MKTGVPHNIPEGWSTIDACMNIPVEIKGITIRYPYRCVPNVNVHRWTTVQPWIADVNHIVDRATASTET